MRENKYPFVDLHLHSYYSDGTMSAEEIVRRAVANKVGVLAITDHNIMTAARELREIAPSSGICYIPGVELDSIDRGVDIHILGYGIDLENLQFNSFVKKNREILDQISIRLISDMEGDYEGVISLEDFHSFSYDREKGGWKALHYFKEKGLTSSLREGFSIYNRYGITNDSGEYPSVEEVIRQIHRAGGRAVLAHPGVSIRENNMDRFWQRLLQLVDLGFDGIECYYPTHTEEVTQLCLVLCRERGLLITTGSDCHGTFGYSEIGELKITVDQLELQDLQKYMEVPHE